MQSGIEDDLRALWNDVPAPTAQFLSSLRRGVEHGAPRAPAGRPRRSSRRFVAFAAAFVALGAAAYAATGSPFYSMATSDGIVSNTFTVTDPTPTSLGSVASALTCAPDGDSLACTAAYPAAAGATYHLTGRAGAEALSAGPLAATALSQDPTQRTLTHFTFATGGSHIVIRDDSPPIIACPTPATNGQLQCAPILARQTYPAGTPIYENDVLK
jgi:hypothetical protein